MLVRGRFAGVGYHAGGSMDWASALNTPVKPVPLDTPKVFDLYEFDAYNDPRKLDVISRLAEQYGRDPRLATLAVQIFREAGVQPRDYRGQAAALLKWTQDNIYYVNEPDERLQEPTYTLRVRYGDCDDMAILLYSLARSVRLPARLVISGVTQTGRKVRYHQGDRTYPRGVNWAHIYLQIGDRPYGNPEWMYAEPTMKVPLGWDVVGARSNALVEMNQYAGAFHGSTSTGVAAGSVAGSQNEHYDPDQFLSLNWKMIAVTAAVGAITAVVADLAVGYVRDTTGFGSKEKK